MRTAILTLAATVIAFPAFSQQLSYDDIREGYRSTTFIYPSVRLDNGRFYPIHAGDGIDYCRSAGFYRARERRGEYIRGGLARHKGDRWQYTFDGPLVAHLRCY
jgi:hypothetical protein